jgi:hypothetical protein
MLLFRARGKAVEALSDFAVNDATIGDAGALQAGARGPGGPAKLLRCRRGFVAAWGGSISNFNAL